MLVRHSYLKQPPARGGLLPVALQVTIVPGLELYVRAYEPTRYRAAWRETVGAILNGQASDMNEVEAAVSETSKAMLELIIEKLGAQKDLLLTPSFGGPTKWIAQPSLARRLDGPDT